MGCQGALPGSWTADAAVSRGDREEGSRQFAASLAAVGPSECVPSGHLPPGAGESAGWPPALSRTTSSCKEGTHESSRQPFLQERRGFIFPGSLNVIAL